MISEFIDAQTDTGSFVPYDKRVDRIWKQKFVDES